MADWVEHWLRIEKQNRNLWKVSIGTKMSQSEYLVKATQRIGNDNNEPAPGRGVTAYVPPWPNNLYRMAYFKPKNQSCLEK